MRAILATSLFGIISLVVILKLYRDYTPQASVDFQIPAQEASRIAQQYLEESGFDLTSSNPNPNPVCL